MADLNPDTEFLAVDMVIRSKESLAVLREVWDWAQTRDNRPTKSPRWLLITSRDPELTADRALQAAINRVNRLPAAARRCWDRATTRTFDIGIQCGLRPPNFEKVVLREKTLRSLNQIGGQVLVTIYAPYREDK